MIRAAITELALRAVRERAPRGVEVVALDDAVDFATIDFLVPEPEDASIIERLSTLRQPSMIQTMSAGTDWIEPHVPPGTILCNARGARDAPVAEWVLGALLGASTGMLRRAHQAQMIDGPLNGLGGTTALIVGMGSIGRRVAAYLTPFHVKVIGVASSAHDGLHGVDELPALLSVADSVVVLAPLTEATRGLIGRAELAALRDGAVVVNAARGPIIDTQALLAELETGRLQAVLDVTDPEPLPPDHPLWFAAGTLAITPHIAGDSPAARAAAAALAGDQLACWAGEKPLRNVVLSRNS